MKEKRGVCAFNGQDLESMDGKSNIFFIMQDAVHLLNWHGLELEWTVSGDNWRIEINGESYWGNSMESLYYLLVGMDSQRPEGPRTTYRA
jgi:hypothetical protein